MKLFLILLFSVPSLSETSLPYGVRLQNGSMALDSKIRTQSHLIVVNGEKTRDLPLPAGSLLFFDQSKKGYVIVRSPTDFFGVTYHESAIHVNLIDLKQTPIIDHVIYWKEGPERTSFLAVKAVMNPNRNSEEIQRELVAVQIEPETGKWKLTKVLEGDWLPSSNDIELTQEGTREGLSRKYRKELLFDGKKIKFKRPGKRKFETISLSP